MFEHKMSSNLIVAGGVYVGSERVHSTRAKHIITVKFYGRNCIARHDPEMWSKGGKKTLSSIDVDTVLTSLLFPNGQNDSNYGSSF